MGPVLVVGATGQLGTAVVDRLAKARRARARARPAGRRRGSSRGGRRARLRRPARAGEPRRGVPGNDHGRRDRQRRRSARARRRSTRSRSTGYDNLLDACRAEDVRRIVFMSVVPRRPLDKSVTTFRLKRRTEEKIQGSGLAYSIFRGRLLHGRLVRADGQHAFRCAARRRRRCGGHSGSRRASWPSPAPRSTSAGSRSFRATGGPDTRPSRSTTSRRSSRPRRRRPEDGENLVENLGGPEILSLARRRRHFFAGARKALEDDPHAGEGLPRRRRSPRALSPPAGNLMAMSWISAACDTAFDGKPARGALRRPPDDRRGIPAREGGPAARSLMRVRPRARSLGGHRRVPRADRRRRLDHHGARCSSTPWASRRTARSGCRSPSSGSTALVSALLHHRRGRVLADGRRLRGERHRRAPTSARSSRAWFRRPC